jgi:hypothetical protein
MGTLTAWALRALDVEAWYQGTISLARSGPEALLPHERGQVAHVVSTLEGVGRFCFNDEPPRAPLAISLPAEPGLLATPASGSHSDAATCAPADFFGVRCTDCAVNNVFIVRRATIICATALRPCISFVDVIRPDNFDKEPP